MARSEPSADTKFKYKYIAKDIDGKTVKGEESASDTDELYSILADRGLYMQSAFKMFSHRRKKKLGPKLLSEFCHQLSSLLGAGVNLVSALSIISREDGLKPEIKKVYEELLTDVRKGTNLSTAMEATGIFPDIMLGMIRAGEANGDLAAVTGRLAEHFTKEYRLEQQVRSALTYPAILGILALAVTVIIMTFVLPQFEDLFDHMAELPAVTRLLMNTSDFIVQKWYIVAVSVIGAVIAFRILLSVEAVRHSFDRLKINLPVIGRLIRVVYTARFARTLSSLYSSGVPITSALLTARDTVGSSYIEGQFDDLLVSVRGGMNLSDALEKIDGFSKKLVSTVRVGEETGQLETMLNSVADFMEYDSSQATKRMMTVLEPLLLIFMAAVVGFIMIAVMLPIIQSYGAIEGFASI